MGVLEARRPDPWRVSDAPEAFRQSLVAAIVGIEIPIARLEGKWKTSQNRPRTDREGVAAGLESAGTEGAAGMAELVRRTL